MIIDFIKAVILGLVEGLSEFLPVSSTGHLILVNQWIKFSEPFTTMFDIVIQLGAVMAVVVYWWRRLLKKPVWSRALIGVVPAIVLGGVLGNTIEAKLFHPLVVAASLIIGGLILLWVENRRLKIKFESIESMPFLLAIYVGLIQCLALIPGTSRAAATIIGAMLLGLSRTAAVEFSFYLAIPTMVAASGYSFLKHGTALNPAETLILALGFVTAFFTALLVIKFLMNFIKKHDLKIFGWYRLVLGGLVLLASLL